WLLTWNGSPSRHPARATPLAKDAIEPNCDNDDEANCHLLNRLWHVEHDKTIEKHPHDHSTDDGVADLASATEERCASDHRSCNSLELKTLPRYCLGSHNTGSEDEGGNTNAKAADHIYNERNNPDIDAGSA